MPNAFPRTDRVWLKRLLRGSVITHKIGRADALYRLRNLELVAVQRVGRIGTGYTPTHVVSLTPEGVIAAGSL